LPGVKTARFAGEDKDPRKNMSLLLEKLKGIDDRSAQFRTCIALILGNKEYLFEGKVRGSISNELQGEGGFGYDPIFIPEGFDRTFGQLSSKIKNEISHRKRAMDQLVEFLEKNQ
jgi:XTP/dITP diphosphohydrolase